MSDVSDCCLRTTSLSTAPWSTPGPRTRVTVRVTSRRRMMVGAARSTVGRLNIQPIAAASARHGLPLVTAAISNLC